jgi:heterodisulfide reductase subunit A
MNLDEQPYERDLHVGAIVLSIGYALSDPAEYGELGYGRFPNVIHSMQYERLASRSGPTEGVVLRPSDGKPPKRIAWLQCVGSRDQKYPYCSSICCMYATKEAMLAKERVKGVHTQIFIMDERAFNKEFNAYYEEAQRQAIRWSTPAAASRRSKRTRSHPRPDSPLSGRGGPDAGGPV